jgi:hypothetical protein
MAKWEKYVQAKYERNWFEVSSDERCRHCNGYALYDCKNIDRDWTKCSDPVELDEKLISLKKFLKNYLDYSTCQKEEHQIQMLHLLVKKGVTVEKYLPLLFRFAASSGHIRLLYFLTMIKECDWERRFGDDVFQKVQYQEKTKILLQKLLCYSMASRKVILTHFCISMGCIERLSQQGWTAMIKWFLASNSLSIAYLFLENNRITTVTHVYKSIQYASFFWHNWSGNRKRLELVSLKMLQALEDEAIREEEAFFVLLAADYGRADILRYLKTKDFTFNHFDRLPLYQTVLFGHSESVKVLIKECNAETNIFGGGRILVLMILIIDHLLLLFIFGMSAMSLVNELYCELAQLGYPKITIFEIIPGDNWCIENGYPAETTSSIPVFVFFSFLYFGLSKMVAFCPLLYCILLVVCHRPTQQRRVFPEP